MLDTNYFLTECAARGPKPLPMSKDFSHSKNDWLDIFFLLNFRKSRPVSKGFLPQKRLIWQYLCEMGLSSKAFFDQNGTHV